MSNLIKESSRGVKAQQILDNELYIETLDTLKKSYEEAIFQTDDTENKWYKHNLYFSTEGNWPNITEEQQPMENYVDYAKENYKEDKTKLFKAIPAVQID